MPYVKTAHMSSQGLSWKPLDFEGSDIVTERISDICQEWEHTPYMSGQQVKGVGADCMRFVCGVMDELYGQKHEIPRQIQDQSLHDPKGAAEVLKMIQGYYLDLRTLEVGDRCVEPGDVIITGHGCGGPGHAIIVGARKNTVWQALKQSVRMGGLGLLTHYQQIFVIFRPDKKLWIPTES